jgi:hypothetical protein
VGTVIPVEIPIAVRAWAPRDSRQRVGGGARWDIGASPWSLVFDTETTTDTAQRLRVGAFELSRGRRFAGAGLFYEPEAISPEELEVLLAYAGTELALLTRAEFVERVFLPTAWDRRGLIVGHNLPFDLARLSLSHHPPQSGGTIMRGGFSFSLAQSGNASRVQVKKANAGAAFIRLTIPGGVQPEERNRQRGGQQQNHHGYFLDTATLGEAMFGGRPSLKLLGKLLGTRHRKSDADHGEQITPEYLDYLRNDVRVTAECAEALQARYERYELPKQPWEIYSEATIGKAHMEKMRLRPFRELNRWSSEITATVMETYYGGRAECAVRKVPVPGVYVDFASQYPTVFALQDLHPYLTAERVSYQREEPERVQRLLDGLTVGQVLGRDLWRNELSALVLIAPDGDRLPTRARYNASHGGRSSRKRAPGTYNVGVPFRYGGPAQWYTLADACASKLMTGRAPRVLRVLRFAAEGCQANLEPIDIAGRSAYRVDPGSEDFIRRLVELRAEVRAGQAQAEATGHTSLEAELDATQQAMKITANGTAYGSAIELNPIEHRKGAWVRVHLPDGTSYRLHRERTEEPGRWFHPLIATLVAGAGRLLLASAMRLVNDLGGSWAFCDTDSLFIIATEHGRLIPCLGGSQHTPSGERAIKALSWEEALKIVGAFASLDPYLSPGHPKSILEVEDENYDPHTHEQREIECLAIAAKRYGLFTRRPDGTPQLVSTAKKKTKKKRSEHGLGHLLPPYARDPEASEPKWLDEWWEHLLYLELGYADHPEPSWFDHPAVGRLTVTSQRDASAFAAYNAALPYAEQVKPWNFLAIAHPADTERARVNGAGSLIAPFERDPIKRLHADWIDRNQPGQPSCRIHTSATPEYRPGSTVGRRSIWAWNGTFAPFTVGTALADWCRSV